MAIQYKQLYRSVILLLILLISGIVLVPVSLHAQKTIIRGNVQDAITKEVLIGANVVEYDKDQRIITGTITDVNGNFNLAVASTENILVVGYIGYKAKEIKLTGMEFIQVLLETESIEVEEVVIVRSYNVDNLTGISERNQAGSRVKVEMIDTKDIGSISAGDALQGQVSGLDITSSGSPGAGAQIVIRGLGSLGDSRPLIVIDGIAMDLKGSNDFDFGSADQEDIGDLVNIAPQDIKSIEVLKDAATTAVWGSKGADGVLLIETFKGKRGGTKFDYQGKYSVDIEPSPIPMLNGDEYQTLQSEQYHNAYGIYTKPDEISNNETFKDYNNYNKNTNWLDEISRLGLTNDQYFSASGGGSKTRYFASVNYVDQKGTVENTALKRLSTRVNLDYDISKKIKFSVQFSYTNANKEDNYTFKGNTDANTGSDLKTVRAMAFVKAPNMSIYEYDELNQKTGEYFTPIVSYQGEGTTYFNPKAITDLSRNDALENDVSNSYILDLTILPWLKFRETVSFQYANQKKISFLPYNAMGADWLNEINNDASESNSSSTKIATRTQLFIIPKLGKNHSFTGVVMAETDQRSRESIGLSTYLSPSARIIDPASNGIINKILSGSSEERSLGLFFSSNYVFMNRYIATFNVRTDGSSKFGSNNRWGTFPSIGTAWIFSEESFLKNPVISTGKLRASYGLTGKDAGNVYDRHGIYESGNPSLYIDNAVVIPTQIQLDNLRWQTVVQSNIALDLGFFKDGLTFTGEYYVRNTKDLLWPGYDIPTTSGFNNLKRYNAGEIQNKGWEISSSGYPYRNNNISIKLYFNISHNTNSFLKFPDNFNNEKDMTVENGQYPRIAIEGNPLGTFYGFKYLGVYPSTSDVVALDKNNETIVDVNGNTIPIYYSGKSYEFQGGDAKYKDMNYDGVIDINDVVALGDSNPDFFGGFGGTFKYKDFSMGLQFVYRTGFQIVNEVAMNTEGMLNKNNQSKAVLHRWRKEGDNFENMLPRAYFDHPANNLGSDRYVEDGDFLRLNNLTLRYSLNNKIIKILPIESFDVALTMRKILTITNYTGVDPEIQQKVEDAFWFGTDNAQSAPPKMFTLSISVGF
ncbi:MAG: SusC/RagA family TonB-linked outer membrane protein [Bacteroidales bacterium]|nr:SusC/RagA family TonB-linked outer membrane protein [Bacteroidales bacterium]MCF8389350.1 SusC/RagA family TonB-linked outer membrane protein [Bacteroidales bacterium]